MSNITNLFFFLSVLTRCRRRGLVFVFFSLFSCMGIPAIASAEAMLFGDSEKGEVYAQQKCTSCHISRFGNEGNEIYTRSDRRIKTVEGLGQQVQFCNANTGAGFSEEQQDDITAYLNERFYQFGDE